MGFDFKIEYKPGRDNLAADALSRCFALTSSQPQELSLNDLKSRQANDSYYGPIRTQLQETDTGHSVYSLKQGLLYWKGRLVIPDDHNLKQRLLHDFHSSLLGGHAGSLRTFMRLASQFFWKGMRREVHNFVQACMICQQAKSVTKPPSGLLQPLPVPQHIWEDIAMDFVCGLPCSKGFSVILVVVDRLSKYGHFMPLKNDFSSVGVADIFINFVLKLHGVPRSIVCDRDKTLTSRFWQHLFSKMGTSIQMSTAYYP